MFPGLVRLLLALVPRRCSACLNHENTSTALDQVVPKQVKKGSCGHRSARNRGRGSFALPKRPRETYTAGATADSALDHPMEKTLRHLARNRQSVPRRHLAQGLEAGAATVDMRAGPMAESVMSNQCWMTWMASRGKVFTARRSGHRGLEQMGLFGQISCFPRILDDRH